MVELQTDEQTPGADAAPQAQAHDEHVYDGITEYDNPIPAWWTWIFVGTIVFSLIYFLVAVMSGGQLSAVAYYDRAVVADLKRQGGALSADAGTLMRLLKDDDSLQAGSALYATNCASCHARDGAGLIGPILSDDAHINVERVTDIVDVVRNGRNNGMMPAWSNRLSPNEIVQVSAYVASLRGKNLPGKAAEGKVIAPWSAQ